MGKNDFLSPKAIGNRIKVRRTPRVESRMVEENQQGAFLHT
jgi:hypothetical protein